MMNTKIRKILIVGFGDIGRRVADKLAASRHQSMVALMRRAPPIGTPPRDARVEVVRGDLSRRRSLEKLYGIAETVLHFAPPPSRGKVDTHTQNLLSALQPQQRGRPLATTFARAPMLPRRIVYISTTGVYGNCMGEWIDESRPLKAESARAKRRVDAERRLQKWGRLNGVAITVLRAPGIYAEDRLPIERIRRGIPALMRDEDGFTNHIHADDLANAAILAMKQQWPKRFRVFNVVDDSRLLMGDYFDLLADAFRVARPPRVSRREAEAQISPMQLSFMRESRRIGNARIKRELAWSMRYPSVQQFLAESACDQKI